MNVGGAVWEGGAGRIKTSVLVRPVRPEGQQKSIWHSAKRAVLCEDGSGGEGGRAANEDELMTKKASYCMSEREREPGGNSSSSSSSSKETNKKRKKEGK